MAIFCYYDSGFYLYNDNKLNPSMIWMLNVAHPDSARVYGYQKDLT